jgi:hypothetical protein
VEFGSGEDEEFSRRERRFIQRVLGIPGHHAVQSVIEVKSPLRCSGIEERKAALLADFRNSVFKDRVSPNPPKRGPQGEAVIELAPGSAAKNNGPFNFPAFDERPSSV